VAVKNKFTKGDSLELMTPQGNMNFTLEHLENGKGEAIEWRRATVIPSGCRFRKRWS
jgi:putative protease